MGCYNRAEIEGILEQYGDMIYRVAYLQLKSRDRADDIYQEVCLRLLKRQSGFDGEEHLRAWLLRATHDCCRDFWKSAWYRRVSLDDELLREIPETPSEQETGFLTECMQRLPEKYRIILHLYYYEEYSIKEVAELLTMKESTVASRLSRGRSRLKKIVEKGGDVYEF